MNALIINFRFLIGMFAMLSPILFTYINVVPILHRSLHHPNGLGQGLLAFAFDDT